jgi:signal transduction histidine kinase
MVVVVFDTPALVESSLAYLEPGGVDIAVIDKTASEDGIVLYSHLSRTRHRAVGDVSDTPAPVHSDPVFVDEFDVNNRHWKISMTPAPGYFRASITADHWLLFAIGLAATTLLCAYLGLARRRELDLRNEKSSLEQIVAKRTRDLEERNKELESYSYSIAHDLRAPLRSITSFTQILADEAASKLSHDEQDYLARIVAAGQFMATLIDDILELAKVSRGEMVKQTVDLSQIARDVSERQHAMSDQYRPVNWKIQDSVTARGDARLLTVLFENLFGNARKFASRVRPPEIEFGSIQRDGTNVYFVKDNGIGFDMAYAEKIFGVFQRLHRQDEYEGTGIGLATVQRIVERHGGRIWVESHYDGGAVFFFTLGTDRA